MLLLHCGPHIYCRGLLVLKHASETVVEHVVCYIKQRFGKMVREPLDVLKKVITNYLGLEAFRKPAHGQMMGSPHARLLPQTQDLDWVITKEWGDW